MKKQDIIFGMTGLVLIVFIIIGVIGFFGGSPNYSEVQKDYNLSYKSTTEGLIIKMSNPCLTLVNSKGFSMHPCYENNSFLIVDICFPAENLKKGDVIVFYKQSGRDLFTNKKVAHRVTDIHNEWVITKGDNNVFKREKVYFYDIHSKVIGNLNIGG